MKSQKPTHLDLFSGIGGFAIAAQWAGFRTIGFCEIDAYCRKVLAKNFGAIMADTAQQSERESTHEANAVGTERDARMVTELRRESRGRIFPDIFDLDGTAYRGVSLITGGFPCQPFSVAGKRRGAADDRAIWPQMFRVISESRPAWVLGENVTGIVPMELDNVLSDLEGIGYATRAFVIPACAVDAKHRRDRLWIIGRNISDSESPEREWRRSPRSRRNGFTDVCRWLPEPSVGRMAVRLPGELDCYRYEPEWEGVPRVATGVKDRVNRLRALGNGIQSQVAYEILREIRKLC